MARLKRPVNLALDPELMDQLEAWIAEQEVRTSKTAVFEAMIRLWLRENGKREKRRSGAPPKSS